MLLYYEGQMHRLSLDKSEQLQVLYNMFLSPRQSIERYGCWSPVSTHLPSQTIDYHTKYQSQMCQTLANYFMQFAVLIC